MDEGVNSYRSRKLAMLENDFEIELETDDYMNLMQAKSKYRIDNIMYTIFQKYL